MTDRKVTAIDGMAEKIWSAQNLVNLSDLRPEKIVEDFVCDKNAKIDFLLERLRYARAVIMLANRSGPNRDMPNPYSREAYKTGQDAVSAIYELLVKGGYPKTLLDNVVPETPPQYDSTEDSFQALISLTS